MNTRRLSVVSVILRGDDMEKVVSFSFSQHVELVAKQEGCTVEKAKFVAWCEGPDGYDKRLEAEQSKRGEQDEY